MVADIQGELKASGYAVVERLLDQNQIQALCKVRCQKLSIEIYCCCSQRNFI